MGDVKRYDFEAIPVGMGECNGVADIECVDGDYVRHSDYAAILARHNALVEAVTWSRECEDCDQWAFEEFWVYDDELTKICAAARADVDRLIGEGEG